MPIVLISSRFEGGGEELAARLAEKTGWPTMNRSEIQELARASGIRTGRLELSVIKAPSQNERLSRERRLYLAFLRATICERAASGNLIYNGRAGHLLFPGISHCLRVGLEVPYERRIERTARTLRLSQARAELYLQQLDQDFDKWVKFIHGVDSRAPGQFDVFLNLEQIGLSNAAALICGLADTPDFRPTPASSKRFADVCLASRAELLLASDPRTAAAELQVVANDGVVTVTYPPRDEEVAVGVPKVLEGLQGCRAIHCTRAETNILWVQERFDPDSEDFRNLTRLAQRWGAAVELLRMIPEEEAECRPPADQGEPVVPLTAASRPDGGVEDDSDQEPAEDGGLRRTREALLNLGQSAGQHSVCGGVHKLVEVARDRGRYSLVVIGSLFLSKGQSARTRMTRELALALRDRLKAPVITSDELVSRFMFGPRQALKLVGLLATVAFIYAAVFTHQEPVLDFLGGGVHARWKWVTPLGVAVFAPIVAYLYGMVAGLLLKLVNID